MTEGSPGAPDRARILEQRARELAAPLKAEDTVKTIGVLLVNAGRERCAIELDHVVSIAPAVELTPVPGTAGFWKGLANVHGKLWSVLDLAGYLGAQPGADDRNRKHLVLVNGAGIEVGLLVEGVSDVTWLRTDAIGPPPGPGRGRRVIQGVTSDLLSLLDVEALLSDPDLAVDDEAA